MKNPPETASPRRSPRIKLDDADEPHLRRGSGAGQPEIQREQRHAERRERHVAGADLAAHQPAAKGRADPDANRKSGEKEDNDIAVGA
jgi:hypothetical protein